MTTAQVDPEPKPAWTAPQIFVLTAMGSVAGGGYSAGFTEDNTYIGALS